MNFTGEYCPRSSAGRQPGGPPGETEVLRLNPSRRTRILDATGWETLEPGSMNLAVSIRDFDALLSARPIITEQGKTFGTRTPSNRFRSLGLNTITTEQRLRMLTGRVRCSFGGRRSRARAPKSWNCSRSEFDSRAWTKTGRYRECRAAAVNIAPRVGRVESSNAISIYARSGRPVVGVLYSCHF
jgi:hypothetical protein